MAERNGLLNRRRGNLAGGSNPPLSAIFYIVKNGERSRKASLHAATAALHSKAGGFSSHLHFTVSALLVKTFAPLTCEEVRFASREACSLREYGLRLINTARLRRLMANKAVLVLRSLGGGGRLRFMARKRRFIFCGRAAKRFMCRRHASSTAQNRCRKAVAVRSCPRGFANAPLPVYIV